MCLNNSTGGKKINFCGLKFSIVDITVSYLDVKNYVDIFIITCFSQPLCDNSSENSKVCNGINF